MGYIDGIHVTIYSSTMDPMGNTSTTNLMNNNNNDVKNLLIITWRWLKIGYPYTWMVTLWLFNIAMENGPFIDSLPIKNGYFPWLC